MSRSTVPAHLDRLVREESRNRCGYCLSPQRLVMARLEIEHITPRAKGGTSERSNLWLSCPLCNSHKGDKIAATDPETGVVVPLFNPRTQRWSEHFRWSGDGTLIHGLSPIGRATVAALHLSSDPYALVVRGFWVAAGWHPPRD